MNDEPAILFEVATPLDFTVRTSPQYWQKVMNAYRTDAIKEGDTMWRK